jgi:hypothetical protein
MEQRVRGFFLALLLGGCAQAPVVQSPAELKGTHGFVHASLPVSATALRLRSAAAGTEHTLVRQPQHGPHAYGLWVPEGQYEIVDLRSPDGTAYVPVSVSRGRVTDLGGIVRFEIGNYEFVRLPVRHPELVVESREAVRSMQAFLASPQPIEWRPQGPPQAERIPNPPSGLGLIVDLIAEYDRKVNRPPLSQQLKGLKTTEEFFSRATAAMPPLTDEPGVDAEGRLYYGAELGQIRVRARNGEWSHLDTGTLEAVSAVEISGRTIVAGTAAGELRVSDDGKTWRRAFALPAGESVVDIDRAGSRWIVLAARLDPAPNPQFAHVRSTDRVKVYSSTQDDLGAMAMLREIALPEKKFIIRGMGLRGQHAGGTYYLGSGPDLLKLDLATLQWSSATPPGHRVDGVHISPKGVLTVYRQQGAFSKLQLSTDQGKTWREADTPPYVFNDVYFESPQNGLATRYAMGAFSSTIEFMAYDAAANTWKKTHEAPAGCVRVLRDADNLQRWCVTSGSSILNYEAGRWLAEFAVN